MSNEYMNDATSPGKVARLEHQAGLVGNATGLLPPLLEDTDFRSVLDIGCGPGRWVFDMGFEYPVARVVGIDISPEMIAYASARARSQGLRNVSFETQDFLTNALPFAERSFDLINVRFAAGWVKGYATWLLFLCRCSVLLKPGGWLIVTEGEGIYTNSLALQRLQEILCAALFNAGYSLSASPRFLGVVAQLGHLLVDAGFHEVQTAASVLDYSHYREEANRAWRDSFHALISEAAPFLLNCKATTAQELAQVDRQILIDMFQEGFCGIGPLFTFSAQKAQAADG